MIEVGYRPSFLRALKKLPRGLQEEVIEKVEQFKDPEQHARLKVHKLHGELQGFLSFSVNYRYRVIFMWLEPGKDAVLHGVGDHSIYT